jgi:hypothetical protein
MKPFCIFKGKTERCYASVTAEQRERLIIHKNSKAWMTATLYANLLDNLPVEIRGYRILIVHDGFKGHLANPV